MTLKLTLKLSALRYVAEPQPDKGAGYRGIVGETARFATAPAPTNELPARGSSHHELRHSSSPELGMHSLVEPKELL